MNQTTFQAIDRRITRWMAEHGLSLLRISIGLIFLWFGAIKFWPGLSAADQLATDTIEKIQFGKMSNIVRLVFATAWEVANRKGRLKVDKLEKED